MTDERIHEITDWLQDDFPRAFPKKPAPKLALKIGIHRDLFPWAEMKGVSRKELGKVLYNWCRGRRYQLALVNGGRYDLTGKLVA